MLLRGSRAAVPRALVLIAIVASFHSPLWANPFIGAGDAPAVAPVQAGGAAPGSLVRGQLDLRNRLAAYLGSWQDSPSARLLSVVLIVSFVYGILHALGPGHRKTVVFSVYLARNAPWWEPMASSLALAGLHGGTAVLLVLMFGGVSRAISVATNSLTIYMEGAAYCALIVMAVVLLTRAVVDLARATTHADSAMSLGTLILTGVYPCPGALLVLVLSLTLHVMGIGIGAVVAMSLGMSVPIAVFAYLGWFGRTGLFSRLRGNEAALRKAGSVVEIAGYALLLVFSVTIALPFIVSVARLSG